MHNEKRDLILAWAGISLAFYLLLRGSLNNTLLEVIASAGTVGLGFILHELAHRLVAKSYGFEARFVADYKMLAFAIFLAAAVGVIFAAPGAVITRGRATLSQHGKIALAGPATNAILGLLFLAGWLASEGIFSIIMRYGFLINGFLAAFNLIPVRPFDGYISWKWNKPLSTVVLLIGLALYSTGLSL